MGLVGVLLRATAEHVASLDKIAFGSKPQLANHDNTNAAVGLTCTFSGMFANRPIATRNLSI